MLSLTAFLAAAAGGVQAHAESFGINFLGNATAQTVTATAGVEPISGWNNIANASFTSGTIYSSDGTISATLSMSGSGRGNGWNNGSTADGGDASLMRGYVDAGINNPVTNVISGLTSSSYTVYIYAQGDSQRPSNGGDWLPNYTVNGTPYYAALLGGGFSGFTPCTVALANNNTYPPALSYGNYLVINNVTPVGGTITVSANSDNRTWRSPLNGIEIVAETSAIAPSISAQSASSTNYAGTTVQLTVVASGTPLFYHWKAGAIGSGVYTNLVNGPGITGVTNSTLTLSNITVARQADYIVEITNSAGSAVSASPITVQVVTMFLDGAWPAAATVYPGAAAHFNVSATGTAPLTYHWRKGGTLLSESAHAIGTGTASLTLSGVTAQDAGSYDVVVTNIYGAVTSAVAVLNVTAAPKAGSYAATLLAKGPVAYWRFNDPDNITANDFGGGHTGFYGSSSATGQAGPASPDWPGFESDNTSVGTFLTSEESRVEVPAQSALNLNTNTVTITAWVYPYTFPSANAGLVFQRGNGGVAGLNINGNHNLGYNWNDDGATWSWDSGLALPLGQWSFVALVVSPTNAIMYLYNAAGQNSASFIHNHANAPFAGLLDIGADPMFHDGSRVFDGNLDEVAIFNRCVSSSELAQLYTAAAATLVAPSISVQPQSQVVLAGTSVQFSATAAGSEPLAYQWQKDGMNLTNGNGLSGVTTSLLTLSQVSIANNGNYTLAITNAAGYAISSVASLTVVVPTNYDQGVTALNPLGYWRLNETGGTTAADASGHGLNGAYQAGVVLGVPGVSNSPYAGFENGNLAALFGPQDGSYVSLPALNLNSATASFTAWIYPTNANQVAAAGLIYCRDGAGTTSGLSYNQGGNQLGYTWNDDGGTYGWSTGLVPPVDQWSFVALVVTPTNVAIYLYNTNGLSAATTSHTHAASAFAGETRIGNDALGVTPPRTFGGRLDEVAVFNYALSVAQVKELYFDGSIGGAVAPAVRLNAVRAGADVVLDWSQGTLLEATNVSGPWTTNTAAKSPFTVSPTEPKKFYRVLTR